jgi:hypothetical protein
VDCFSAVVSTSGVLFMLCKNSLELCDVTLGIRMVTGGV